MVQGSTMGEVSISAVIMHVHVKTFKRQHSKKQERRAQHKQRAENKIASEEYLKDHRAQNDGSLEFYDEETALLRSKLRHDAGVEAELDKWWNACMHLDEDNNQHLNFEEYTKLHDMLVTAFNADDDDTNDLDDVQAQEALKEDWDTDRRGYMEINKEMFKDAIFQLADTWLDHVDKKGYIDFLQRYYGHAFEAVLKSAPPRFIRDETSTRQKLGLAKMAGVMKATTRARRSLSRARRKSQEGDAKSAMDALLEVQGEVHNADFSGAKDSTEGDEIPILQHDLMLTPGGSQLRRITERHTAEEGGGGDEEDEGGAFGQGGDRIRFTVDDDGGGDESAPPGTSNGTHQQQDQTALGGDGKSSKATRRFQARSQLLKHTSGMHKTSKDWSKGYVSPYRDDGAGTGSHGGGSDTTANAVSAFSRAEGAGYRVSAGGTDGGSGAMETTAPVGSGERRQSMSKWNTMKGGANPKLAHAVLANQGRVVGGGTREAANIRLTGGNAADLLPEGSSIELLPPIKLNATTAAVVANDTSADYILMRDDGVLCVQLAEDVRALHNQSKGEEKDEKSEERRQEQRDTQARELHWKAPHDANVEALSVHQLISVQEQETKYLAEQRARAVVPRLTEAQSKAETLQKGKLLRIKGPIDGKRPKPGVRMPKKREKQWLGLKVTSTVPNTARVNTLAMGSATRETKFIPHPNYSGKKLHAAVSSGGSDPNYSGKKLHAAVSSGGSAFLEQKTAAGPVAIGREWRRWLQQKLQLDPEMLSGVPRQTGHDLARAMDNMVHESAKAVSRPPSDTMQVHTMQVRLLQQDDDGFLETRDQPVLVGVKANAGVEFRRCSISFVAGVSWDSPMFVPDPNTDDNTTADKYTVLARMPRVAQNPRPAIRKSMAGDTAAEEAAIAEEEVAFTAAEEAETMLALVRSWNLLGSSQQNRIDLHKAEELVENNENEKLRQHEEEQGQQRQAQLREQEQSKDQRRQQHEQWQQGLEHAQWEGVTPQQQQQHKLPSNCIPPEETVGQGPAEVDDSYVGGYERYDQAVQAPYEQGRGGMAPDRYEEYADEENAAEFPVQVDSASANKAHQRKRLELEQEREKEQARKHQMVSHLNNMERKWKSQKHQRESQIATKGRGKGRGRGGSRLTSGEKMVFSPVQSGQGGKRGGKKGMWRPSATPVAGGHMGWCEWKEQKAELESECATEWAASTPMPSLAQFTPESFVVEPTSIPLGSINRAAADSSSMTMLERKRLREERNQRENAWHKERRMALRREAKRDPLQALFEKEAAATAMQAALRGYMLRKEQKSVKEAADKKEAAEVLQAKFRGFTVRQTILREQQVGATQAEAKAKAEKKQIRDDATLMNVILIGIEEGARHRRLDVVRLIANKTGLPVLEVKRSVTAMCEGGDGHPPLVLARDMQKGECEELVLPLQKTGCIVYTEVSDAHKANAIAKIQARSRGRRHRRQGQQKQEQKQTAAAVKIQSISRGRKARSQPAEHHQSSIAQEQALSNVTISGHHIETRLDVQINGPAAPLPPQNENENGALLVDDGDGQGEGEQQGEPSAEYVDPEDQWAWRFQYPLDMRNRISVEHLWRMGTPLARASTAPTQTLPGQLADEVPDQGKDADCITVAQLWRAEKVLAGRSRPWFPKIAGVDRNEEWNHSTVLMGQDEDGDVEVQKKMARLKEKTTPGGKRTLRLRARQSRLNAQEDMQSEHSCITELQRLAPAVAEMTMRPSSSASFLGAGEGMNDSIDHFQLMKTQGNPQLLPLANKNDRGLDNASLRMSMSLNGINRSRELERAMETLTKPQRKAAHHLVRGVPRPLWRQLNSKFHLRSSSAYGL
jgi:hypothetical protein